MRARLHGTEIYFDVEGSELHRVDGAWKMRPTIIALHGGPGFDQGYLRPGLGPLRDHAQIVFVDLRGQGRSAGPALETCTLEQMADDVAALSEHLGIERPVVFGHSAGGFVALHLALRHPDRCGGLILCDSSPTLARIEDDVPRPTLDSRAPPEVAAIAQRFFGGDMSPETMAKFSEHVSPYYGGPSHMDVPAKLFALSVLNTEIVAHFFGQLAARYDLRTQLGDIRMPTLVMVGRYDWVCSPAASRAMARAIPGANLVELTESGHFGFSEEPERFMEAVASFLPRCR